MTSNLNRPTLTAFHYPSGRLGFLVEHEGKQTPLTVNLEGKDLDLILFRTYGETQIIAEKLLDKFVEESGWKRMGFTWVGRNRVAMAKKPEIN
jgi:hypothetical protein